MPIYVFELRNAARKVIATAPPTAFGFKPRPATLRTAAQDISRAYGWKKRGGRGARVTYSIIRRPSRSVKKRALNRRNPARSPFAVCHSSVGCTKCAKGQRCVKQVSKRNPKKPSNEFTAAQKATFGKLRKVGWRQIPNSNVLRRKDEIAIVNRAGEVHGT